MKKVKLYFIRIRLNKVNFKLSKLHAKKNYLIHQYRNCKCEA